MGKIKQMLIDEDINIVRYYLSRKKKSTCASNKCCVNSVVNKDKKRIKRCR